MGVVLLTLLALLLAGCGTASAPSPPTGVDELVVPTPSPTSVSKAGELAVPIWMLLSASALLRFSRFPVVVAETPVVPVCVPPLLGESEGPSLEPPQAVSKPVVEATKAIAANERWARMRSGADLDDSRDGCNRFHALCEH